MGRPPPGDPAAGVSPGAGRHWYVGVGGQVFGPADKAALAQWAAEGRLPASAQVMPVGEQQWTRIGSVPELRDLQLPPAAHPPGLPPPQLSRRPDQLAPCPRCGGSVVNVAPAYGLLFGVLEKTIIPRLRCAHCDTPVALAELPQPARSRIVRSKRVALTVWLAILVPVTGLLVWWLLTRLALLG